MAKQIVGSQVINLRLLQMTSLMEARAFCFERHVLLSTKNCVISNSKLLDTGDPVVMKLKVI